MIEISNFGDYLVEVDDDMYKNNNIQDIIELKLNIGKHKLKKYKIMDMHRKDNKCYFRIKDLDELIWKETYDMELRKYQHISNTTISKDEYYKELRRLTDLYFSENNEEAIKFYEEWDRNW